MSVSVARSRPGSSSSSHLGGIDGSATQPMAEGTSDGGKAAAGHQRILLILTALPLCLAALAFVLQWQSALDGPPLDDGNLPGWQARPSHTHDGSGGIGGGLLPHHLRHCPRPRNNNYMFPYRPWHASLKPKEAPKICICSTTAAGLDQILPWLYYHRTLGVELFLLFVEGKAALPENAAALEAIEGVRVVFRTKELEAQQARSRVWNETWLSFFFFKPCNYELFVRQSLNMEMAIVMARAARVDWIMHVDTDELLYPAGTSEFSLQRLLSEAPDDADTVIFPNYETAIERDDIQDPFQEVTMFKKNFDHVAKEVYFGHYRDAAKGNPNYFLTYGNGKSAARMVDHLRPNGAHRWHNYARVPKEHKFPEAAILHYTYAKFSDLTSRRDRCGCKPNREDVKRCFILEFDRSAFIVASTQTTDQMLQWYREHVVWTDSELNAKLLKKGIFGRIHTPQVIIRGVISSGIVNATIKAGEDLLRQRSLAAATSRRAELDRGVGDPVTGQGSGLDGSRSRDGNVGERGDGGGSTQTQWLRRGKVGGGATGGAGKAVGIGGWRQGREGVSGLKGVSGLGGLVRNLGFTGTRKQKDSRRRRTERTRRTGLRVGGSSRDAGWRGDRGSGERDQTELRLAAATEEDRGGGGGGGGLGGGGGGGGGEGLGAGWSSRDELRKESLEDRVGSRSERQSGFRGLLMDFSGYAGGGELDNSGKEDNVEEVEEVAGPGRREMSDVEYLRLSKVDSSIAVPPSAAPQDPDEV